LQRLSSGLRINSAKDDAAGLAITDRMTSQINGLGQASRNANDGISLTQTAEGALQESTNILQRIRELAVQSGNATNSASDRLSLQSEVDQLVSELDRIAETTSFNGIKLLDGSYQAEQFQVGANSGETINVSVGKATSDSLGVQTKKTDNATQGMEMPTATNSVAINNNSLNSVAIGTTAALANAKLLPTGGQTLTVTNPDGVETDVDLTATTLQDASTIATTLNAEAGVTAFATNNAIIDTSALEGSANFLKGDIVKFTLNTGDTTNGGQTTDISVTYDPDTFSTDFDDALNAAVDAINTANTNTDLTYDSDTNSLGSKSGVNLGIEAFETVNNDQVTLSAFAAGTGNTDSNDNLSFTLDAAANSIAFVKDNTGTTPAAKQINTASNLLEALKADDNYNTNFTAELTTDKSGVIITSMAAADDLAISAFTDDDTDAALGAMTVTPSTGTVLGTTGTLTDAAQATGTVLTTDAVEKLSFSGVSVTENLVAGTTATDSASKTGTLTISLDDGYNIKGDKENTAAGDSILDAAAGVNAKLSLDLGMSDVSEGNYVAAQQLTISGTGSTTVDIAEDLSAKETVSLINAVANQTGVNATGSSTATLSNLSKDGVVSFSLVNSSGDAVSISSNITTDDLTSLANAINDQSGKTGITASLSLNNDAIEISNNTGEDINILDFTSSASTDTEAVTISVAGNESEADPVKLMSGGGAGSTRDSTVIGGEVLFKSDISFTVSSDVEPEDGGLFATDAGKLNASELQSVKSLDISTVEGANDAMNIIDGALANIDSNRADLGAVQNRFTSTISNLSVSIENLSASRSRIQDTDFASETAELTRNQILQQAGTAMLAQANQIPQGVLSLLG